MKLPEKIQRERKKMVPGETRRKNRSIKAGHHKMGERLGIP